MDGEREGTHDDDDDMCVCECVHVDMKFHILIVYIIFNPFSLIPSLMIFIVPMMSTTLVFSNTPIPAWRMLDPTPMEVR